MSDKFEELKAKYENQYITEITLRGWVTLNIKKPGRGITTEEFELITGMPY